MANAGWQADETREIVARGHRSTQDEGCARGLNGTIMNVTGLA